MTAHIQSWSVEQLGPAFSTRQEHADGSVTYEAVNDITFKVTVIGNDGREFIDAIQKLTQGAKLKSIEIEPVKSNERGRKYVFE